MYVSGRTGGQVDRQTDRRVHRRPTPKQYSSDFIGGKPVLSTGYLVSCSRTQRSASDEARSRNPSISGQALYHDCAPQLGNILCRYDTCPTQYAPDLRGVYCVRRVHNMHLERAYCVWSILWLYTAPIGAVCSGSTLFGSTLNSSVMLGNCFQQTTSADDIFRCSFFLAL